MNKHIVLPVMLGFACFILTGTNMPNSSTSKPKLQSIQRAASKKTFGGEKETNRKFGNLPSIADSALDNKTELDTCNYDGLTVERNGIKYNVSRIGHGINIAKSGKTAYNDQESKQDANIFNQTWLNSRYSKGMFDDQSYEESFDSMGSTTKEVSLGLKKSFEEMTEVTAGYACFEASVGVGFEQDFEYSTNVITSNYYTKSFYKYVVNNYYLANAKDYTTYSQHLDSGFLNNVDEYFNGTKTAAALFEDYGSYVLTGASYGGLYEFNSRFSSTEVDFNTAVTNKVKESIGAKISYAGASVGVKETFTQGIKVSTGISISDMSYESKGHSYGGTILGDTVLNDMAAFRSQSKSWAQSVEKKTDIIEYISAVPIYNYLPKDRYSQTQIEKMAHDLETYNSQVEIGIKNNVFQGGYTGETSTFKISLENASFGRYWDCSGSYSKDHKNDKDYAIDLFKNSAIKLGSYDVLKKAEVTEIEVIVSGKLKAIKGNNHNQIATLECDNGIGKNIEISKEIYKASKDKNVYLKGTVSFNSINDCTTFRLNFHENTIPNWIFNEPVSQISNLEFKITYKTADAVKKGL